MAGKALKLDPKVFDSRHGTVLDSGTTYAYLPEQAFVAFRDAVSSITDRKKKEKKEKKILLLLTSNKQY